MVINPMLSMDSVIGLHDLMGSGGMRNAAQELNAQMGTSSVFHGATDPFQRGYEAIRRNFIDIVPSAIDTIRKGLGVITETIKKFLPITAEESLLAIPENMYIPILTMPEIRPLFEQGKIYGFGVSPVTLPEEDVCGRLINNGTVEFVPGEQPPEEIIWEWADNDPDLTVDEIDAIDATRGFICEWLKKELGEEAPRDFTNDMALMKP